MTDGWTGDPGSCSQLGGALRSYSGRLRSLREELAERADGLRRSGDMLVADEVEADLALVDSLVEQLDVGGAALQRYAQDLAELSEATRRLGQVVAAAGLELSGLRVVEPWGVLTTDLARERQRAQPELQHQSDRLSSKLGRARGVTARAMVEGTRALAAATLAARSRSLR